MVGGQKPFPGLLLAQKRATGLGILSIESGEYLGKFGDV